MALGRAEAGVTIDEAPTTFMGEIITIANRGFRYFKNTDGLDESQLGTVLIRLATNTVKV